MSHRRAIARGGATAWWEVAGKTCVVAYQPKGAASLASSYVNLASPGTGDGTTTSAPTWDSETGWGPGTNAFVASSVTPPTDQTYSMLVRFSDAVVGTQNYACGYRYGEAPWQEFSIIPRYNTTQCRMGIGGIAIYDATAAAGVYGMRGKYNYCDAVYKGESGAVAGAFGALWAFGANSALSYARQYGLCKVQAFVVYSAVLTEAEYVAVPTAMAAL